MNKIRERARLLKAFHKTGDEDFLRAAEALQIPLLDHLQQQRRFPGRRGQTVGKMVRPRLYRMHRHVAAGSSVLAAARQEVAEYGRCGHASDEAAVDYLRGRYQAEAASIAAVITACDRMRDHWRAWERHCASVANLWRSAEVTVAADAACSCGAVARQFRQPCTAHSTSDCQLEKYPA